MTYTYDEAASATRDDLVDLVIANSFNPSRYTERVKGWLDDGVTEVCRRLKIHDGAAVLAVDATTGVVTQPTQPFFQLHELWLASGSPATGLEAVRLAAESKIEKLPQDMSAAYLPRGSSLARWYSIKRVAGTGRLPSVEITVHPAGASAVAIVGLQRPAAMADAGDVSGLGADLDDALVAFAKWRAFRNEDDIQMAQFWRAEFLGAITNASEAADETDGPIVTPGTWDE